MSRRDASFWEKIKNSFKNAAEKVRDSGVVNPDAAAGVKKTGRAFGSVIGFILKIALSILLVTVATTSLIVLFGTIYISRYVSLNTSITLEEVSLDETTQFLAWDEGQNDWIIIETVSGIENREWVNYDEIPEDMKLAAVAMEDKRFWEHKGVDWKRTSGALVQMFFQLREGNFGGSTITQQLIKNLTNNNEATVRRKLNEIFQALDFETKYTKEDILMWYLNTIYLGQDCYGVKTAAATYFGKDLDELTLAESACIIGITNNPYMYDPYINPEKNKVRQENILKEMNRQEIISDSELRAAIDEELVFARNTTYAETKIRSWYVDEVIRELTNDLMDRYSWSKQMAQKQIFSGGYRVYCNVDLRIQGIVDTVWGDMDYWPETLDDERPQATMIINDPYEGHILAISGPRGEKTGNLLFNHTTMAVRQPGSSIKPVTVYAPALDFGLITLGSSFDDAPVSVRSGSLWPRNSPNRYDGRVNVLSAITSSKNTVAVRVLDLLTPQRSFEFAVDRMGLSTLVESYEDSRGNQYSDIGQAQLALGGLTHGVTVAELADAYGSFVNGGLRYDSATYNRVLDSQGTLIFTKEPDATVAIKEKTAYYITQALINVVQSGTGTRARMENMPVAGKTGTTSKDYDRWFAGYTPYYVGVTWFGYDPQRRLTGYSSNPALHLWKKVMDLVHEDLPRKEFDEITFQLTSVSLCKDSGLLSTSACGLDIRGGRSASYRLAKEDIPTAHCNVHVIVEIDTISGLLATPYCPEETRKKVAMLDLDRVMPTDGVVLPDEQYTVRDWEQSRDPSEYYPWRPADGTNHNDFCPLHTEAPEIPDITGEFPDFPNYTDFPDYPETGENSPENTPDVTGGYDFINPLPSPSDSQLSTPPPEGNVTPSASPESSEPPDEVTVVPPSPTTDEIIPSSSQEPGTVH